MYVIPTPEMKCASRQYGVWTVRIVRMTMIMRVAYVLD